MKNRFNKNDSVIVNSESGIIIKCFNDAKENFYLIEFKNGENYCYESDIKLI